MKISHMTEKRRAFGSYYNFGEKYIYIIGGQNENKKTMKKCEKFDV